MKPLHIAIVGYGTAGQAAAVLLSRDGHRVEVFEQAARPGPVGAGFLLQPSGLQVLWRMGLLDAALAHGAPVRRLYGETPEARAVMDMRYAGLDGRLFGLGMQRGALFALLAQAWPGFGSMHVDSRIEAIDDDGRRVRDARGRSHGPFDLVIAADGAASRLRGHVAARGLDRPYPWGALWCLLPRARWPWRDELRQRYVAARRMIGMLPVGTRPGDDTPRLSFFWSLPTADFERWQSRGLDAWREEVRGIWPEAEACLDGVQASVQLARASYRDAAPDRWHRGRVLLLGDAAHAMSPQLGQGVNMALLDALSLRDVLRAEDDVAVALARHERERRRHVRIYHFWSRWLTPLFQSERDFAAKLRDIAFLPLGRLPGGRGHMLRVLSGTQVGAFGRLGLQSGFVDALAGHPPGRERDEPGCARIDAPPPEPTP
ncbi:MAG TPA: NAD(P)/FAD-dependent oxidoreductase [Luteimonas sp.]|nr:NAD(P)/FAD-dependent oxidoreductase [Luteimonas sp.]